jgi:hypothetical protein
MRTYRFTTDPKTGKSRTEDGPDTAIVDYKLSEARRQCRDVIRGNVPFHVEPTP